MNSIPPLAETEGLDRRDDEPRLADIRDQGLSSPLPAEVAQLVERNLAKVEVAGSSPVFRSETGPSRSF